MRGPRQPRLPFGELSTLGKVNRIIATASVLVLFTVIAISPVIGFIAIVTQTKMLSGVILLVFGLLLWMLLYEYNRY